jgi:hypothetical protein
MGCTHPLGLDPIVDEDDQLLGVRCPVCRRVVFKGDSLRTTILRALGLKRDAPARART